MRCHFCGGTEDVLMVEIESLGLRLPICVFDRTLHTMPGVRSITLTAKSGDPEDEELATTLQACYTVVAEDLRAAIERAEAARERALVGTCDKCGHVRRYSKFPEGEPIPEPVDCPACVGLGQLRWVVESRVPA